MNFTILWVDDKKEDIEEDVKEHVEAYIKSKALEPKIFLCDDIKEAEEYATLNDIDILATDNSFGENQAGKELIKRMRDKLNRNMDILFYSAAFENLYQVDKSAPPFNRVTYKSVRTDKARTLREAIRELIDLSLLQYSKLPNLRGLILSETSFLETKLSDAIAKYDEVADPSNREIVFNHIKNLIQGSVKSSFKPCAECDKKPFLKPKLSNLTTLLQNHSIFDAYKKRLALSKIIEIHTSLPRFNVEDMAYIFEVRNILAHKSTQTSETGNVYIPPNNNSSERVVSFFSSISPDSCFEVLRCVNNMFAQLDKIILRIPTECV